MTRIALPAARPPGAVQPMSTIDGVPYEPPIVGGWATFLNESAAFCSVVLRSPRLGWIRCSGCHRYAREPGPRPGGVGVWGMCDDCRERVGRIVAAGNRSRSARREARAAARG